MISWRRALLRATLSGSSASLASTAALMACGQRDCGSAFAPVNAISHWLWKDRAIHRDDATLRYTVAGYGIHHAMSVMWAVLYEKWTGSRQRRPLRPLPELGAAAVVAAGACVVDLRCTPERLTPGFERRLSPAALLTVYASFAVGLAIVDAARRSSGRSRV